MQASASVGGGSSKRKLDRIESLKEKYNKRKKQREVGLNEDELIVEDDSTIVTTTTNAESEKTKNEKLKTEKPNEILKKDEPKINNDKNTSTTKDNKNNDVIMTTDKKNKSRTTSSGQSGSTDRRNNGSIGEKSSKSNKHGSSSSRTSNVESRKSSSSTVGEIPGSGNHSRKSSNVESRDKSKSRSRNSSCDRHHHRHRSHKSSSRDRVTSSSNNKAVTSVVASSPLTSEATNTANGGDNLDELQELLSAKTTKEQVETRNSDVIQELLSIPSHKEQKTSKNFKSLGGSQVKQFCQYGTREECLKKLMTYNACKKLHFRKILKPHTDESLGDCSFLNTCFHMETCKYVHYEIDRRAPHMSHHHHHQLASSLRHHQNSGSRRNIDDVIAASKRNLTDDDYLRRKMLPPQWINCDIRYLDFNVLGKFSVIMADPPWDIHMELPYGTMQDGEMNSLRIQDLSDDGLIFLWVTGRAMELGRELFKQWGYKRCDELIWVKTNQLQRLIRTGRTGHWINHGKEHCLIGIKGNPKNINARLDCDVLVAEVRDTSHKPDEIYGIIERLSPGTRKLELFGRMHNIQPNWVTLGNQLDGVHLVESDMVHKFKSKYPSGEVTKTTTTNNNNNNNNNRSSGGQFK